LQPVDYDARVAHQRGTDMQALCGLAGIYAPLAGRFLIAFIFL
jgi:hypothetical protein